ncbi:MAG: GDP-L-fucose synthase [bacterium]
MKIRDKIYIAGHAGLVGSAIVRKLQEDGYNNVITKSFDLLDLRRQTDVEQFFEQEKPDYVFLAAAKVGGILANNTYKAEFIYDNLMIATNIIHASYKCGVKKLLNLGSSCIYPRLAPQPLKEEYLLTSALEQTNEPYAIAKIAAIKLCQYYHEQYGTNFISVMPTNLYGPHDNFNLETGHVLPALVRKFHLAKLLEHNDIQGLEADTQQSQIGFDINSWSHEKIAEHLKTIGITKNYVTLWGTGTVHREFLYIDDLAQALIFLMKNYTQNDIGPFINVGTGIDLRIKELASLIKNIVGFKGTIQWDSNKPDGTPRKLLDTSKIHALGWHHQTSLEEGIKKFYTHYLQRHASNQKRTQGEGSCYHINQS